MLYSSGELYFPVLLFYGVRSKVKDLELMTLMDRQYLKTPFYGSRRMSVWLRREGYLVNRKRVRRLMRVMGIEAIYRRPNTRSNRQLDAPDHSSGQM